MASKKRTKTQLVRDRSRIAELSLQKYTQREIIEVLYIETGVRVSQQQVSYDLGAVKKGWLKIQHENYNALMQEELARIDALESELWRTLRESTSDKEREVVSSARRKIKQAAEEEMTEQEYEMVVTNIQKTIEGSIASPALFAQILSNQQERRKLLGLYAPKQTDIQKTVVVKGYRNVSPDDWDDVIEGELVN